MKNSLIILFLGLSFCAIAQPENDNNFYFPYTRNGVTGWVQKSTSVIGDISNPLTSNLITNGYWLSPDGSNVGVYLDDALGGGIYRFGVNTNIFHSRDRFKLLSGNMEISMNHSGLATPSLTVFNNVGSAVSLNAASGAGMLVFDESMPFGIGGQGRSDLNNRNTYTSVAYALKVNPGYTQQLLTLDSTDRVGILTNTPAYPLHVMGDVNISLGSVYRINGTAIATTDDQNDTEVEVTHTAINYTNTNSYLDGHLSGIDTQLGTITALIPDNIADLTISADVDIDNNKIVNLSPGTTSTDAATYGQLTGSHALALVAGTNGDTITLTNRETLLILDGALADPATFYIDGSGLSSGAKIYIKYAGFTGNATLDRDDDNDPGNFSASGSSSGTTTLTYTGVGTSMLLKAGATWYQMY